MKFKIIITILLFLFSLFYLNKSSNFIKQNDPLMQTLKEKQRKYNTPAINAIITTNTMIPGISGKKINLNKSYQKMKPIKSFNESLLIFDTIPPSKSIANLFNKVILSGNMNKNKISIILEISNNYLFYAINEILLNNNVYVDILCNKNLSLNNTNYKNIITIDYKTYTNYCLTYNLNINNSCQNNKKYTILGTDISNYHLNKTKKVAKNGIILVYHFNENNYNDLSIIIHYLKNNNYIITPINELIME